MNSKIPVSTTAFAISREFEKLQEELEKYARDPSVQGSSVLISGHRGAGKTTLVRLAIADLSKRLETGFKEPRKLLLVPLHGPDLVDERKSFHNDAEANDDKKKSTGKKKAVKKDAADEKEDEADPEKKEAELEDRRIKNILEHITVSLYREAANEFARSFRNRLRYAPSYARQSEQSELLRLELDESPDLQTLRQLWKLHGFLDRGVLFSDTILRTQVANNAGVQEIATLSSAAQAFRIITGTVTSSQTKSKEQLTEIMRSMEQKVITKDIVNGVIGLASGAVVGAGVFESLPTTSGFRLLLSSIAAVATAMFATITIKRSTKSTTSKKSNKEYQFIRRTDISSLNRELPNLIQRMREIGLAPIFVVDELDKVIHPEQFESFGKVIAYLKKLVSENSFFCFLTDRQYFDHISGIYQRSEYPEEYTYFTHKFFVQYRPSELHEYLDRYLQFKNLPTMEEKKQAFQLKYLLLNRARLHNMDLRRELLKWMREGSIVINDDIVQGKYRYQIMLQLAIELIMESSELVNRCDQDPDFHQLVSDTLYYPSREWVKGEEFLVVDPIPFEEYLKKRNAPDEEEDVALTNLTEVTAPEVKPEKVEKTQRAASGKTVKPKNPTISAIDIRLLHDNLMKLVALVCRPDDLKKILNNSKKYSNDPEVKSIWLDLIQTIPVPTPGSVLNVLLLEKVSDNKYRWKFDYFGRPLGKVATETDAPNKIKFIKSVNKAFLAITGNELGLKGLAQLRLIHNSPTWDAVELAINNLEGFSESFKKDAGLSPEDFSERGKYPEINTDYQNLNEYHAKLLARMNFLYFAVVLGWNLKRLTKSANWIDCFSVIPNALDVAMGERVEPIAKLLHNISNAAPRKPDDVLRLLQTTLTLPIVEIEFDPIRQEDAWWERWRIRLLSYYQSGLKKIDLTMHDLLAMTHKIKFAVEFGSSVDAITRETWVSVLVDAFKAMGETGKGTRTLPYEEPIASKRSWIMYPALLQLKLDAVVPTIGTRAGTGDISNWLEVLGKRQSQVSLPPTQRFIILVSKTPLTGPETTSAQYPIVPILTPLWQTEKETITKLIKLIAESYKDAILVVKVDTEDLEKTTDEMISRFVIREKYALVLQLRGDPDVSIPKYSKIENFDQLEKALPIDVKP